MLDTIEMIKQVPSPIIISYILRQSTCAAVRDSGCGYVESNIYMKKQYIYSFQKYVKEA